MPVHHSSTTSTSSTRDCATIGATIPSAISPHTASTLRHALRRRGGRIQTDGQDPSPGRHRGHSRRGLQPHGGGERARPDALSSRGSTTPTTTDLTEDPAYYMDYTGTGNSLNMRNPHVLQLVMDSLRYWVLEMHVDGFRFDLAAALARELHDVDRLSAFFDIDPAGPRCISQVKLIAEPWDVGEGGYQVGNFPAGVDRMERQVPGLRPGFLARRRSALGEFASRFTGSSDLYEQHVTPPICQHQLHHRARRLHLHDLVSYNEKHNEANGEEQPRWGATTRSWNCGVEGPTDDPEVLAPARASEAESPQLPCSSRRGCPCCWAEMRSAAPGRATTTPTARTMRSPGTTGPASTKIFSPSAGNSSATAGITRAFTGVTGS